ncbi:MAG: hypothetical protein J6T92_08110 [Ottowia sp.]|nr:hypothetical protein [Ottowia sp.]
MRSAALLAALLAAGAAQAALPTSITLSGTAATSPIDPCEEYRLEAVLHGMNPSDMAQNAVCVTINVKQGDTERTSLAQCTGKLGGLPAASDGTIHNAGSWASAFADEDGNPLWVPAPAEEFEVFLDVTTDPAGTSGVRSPTIRATCDTDATVVPGTGGPYAICTGDLVDDGNGNCVCPAGRELVNDDECERVSSSGHKLPTMGELGLLLSGIALAGVAAPALRRREKQGKKADTRQ